VFLAQPRTATRSLAAAFKKVGFEKEKGHHGIGVIPEGSVVISAIRNHWDVLVSWFTALHECKGTKMYNWLTERLAKNKSGVKAYFKPHKLFWQFLPLSTHVLRYETLEEDVKRVFEELGLEMPEIPVINDRHSRREGRHYREFYDEQSRLWVYDYYKDEIEKLGYEW
jgi:hypothetical protein